MIDQECLLKKIDAWKETDLTADIFFRPKCEQKVKFSDAGTFLFVYQTCWQKN